METLVSTKKTIIFAFLELLIASHIFHQRMQLWNLTYLMICYIAPTGKPSLETVSYKGQATLKYPFMVIGKSPPPSLANHHVLWANFNQ